MSESLPVVIDMVGVTVVVTSRASDHILGMIERIPLWVVQKLRHDYNITEGGGRSREPQKILRNLCTTPYGSDLLTFLGQSLKVE